MRARRTTGGPSATRRRLRWRGERGSSTVEFVIGAAVMVLLLMVVVQFALWFHTRAAVTTAARHGLDQVRVVDGTVEDGAATTNEFLDQAADGLHDRSVTVNRRADQASVRVVGVVVSVIPGVHLPLTVTVQAPIERTVP